MCVCVCVCNHWQISANIGKYFFRLINKHFPPEHKFHKIFNKNTLKLSYSCMPNLKSLINSHNQNILRDQPQSTPKICNCLKKEDCPMNGFCLTKSLLVVLRYNHLQQRKLYQAI